MAKFNQKIQRKKKKKNLHQWLLKFRSYSWAFNKLVDCWELRYVWFYNSILYRRIKNLKYIVLIDGSTEVTSKVSFHSFLALRENKIDDILGCFVCVYDNETLQLWIAKIKGDEEVAWEQICSYEKVETTMSSDSTTIETRGLILLLKHFEKFSGEKALENFLVLTDSNNAFTMIKAEQKELKNQVANAVGDNNANLTMDIENLDIGNESSAISLIAFLLNKYKGDVKWVRRGGVAAADKLHALKKTGKKSIQEDFLKNYKKVRGFHTNAPAAVQDSPGGQSFLIVVFERKQSKVDEIDKLLDQEIQYMQWANGNAELDRLKGCIAYVYVQAEKIKDGAVHEVEKIKAIAEIDAYATRMKSELQEMDTKVFELTAEKEASIGREMKTLPQEVESLAQDLVRETAVLKNKEDTLKSEKKNADKIAKNIEESKQSVEERAAAVKKAEVDVADLTQRAQEFGDAEKEYQGGLAGKSCQNEEKSLEDQLADAKMAVGNSEIEVVAGGRFFNVVADTETTGKQMLQHCDLRKRVIPSDKQRAASNMVGMEPCVTLEGDIFQPSGLLTVGSHRVGGELLGRLCALADAESDLSTHQKRLSEIEAERAMEFVFGSTFVCKTREAAVKVAFTTERKIDVREPWVQTVGHKSFLCSQYQGHALRIIGEKQRRNTRFLCPRFRFSRWL